MYMDRGPVGIEYSIISYDVDAVSTVQRDASFCGQPQLECTWLPDVSFRGSHCEIICNHGVILAEKALIIIGKRGIVPLRI